MKTQSLGNWSHRRRVARETGREYVPPVPGVWLFVFTPEGQLLRAYRYRTAGSSAKVRIQ